MAVVNLPLQFWNKVDVGNPTTVFAQPVPCNVGPSDWPTNLSNIFFKLDKTGIPAGATITGATFHVARTSPPIGSNWIIIHHSHDFNPATLTWNTMPATWVGGSTLNFTDNSEDVYHTSAAIVFGDISYPDWGLTDNAYLLMPFGGPPEYFTLDLANCYMEVSYIPATLYPNTYVSQIPVLDTDHVKATTYSTFGMGYNPWFACDPSKSLVGNDFEQSWLSGNPANAQPYQPVRFHIDLTDPKVIRRIYFENNHTVGADWVQNRCCRYFTFWGSNNAAAFADLVYSHDTNWTQLPCDITAWARHTDTDQSEKQYALVTNTTAYRYYAMKIENVWTDFNAAIRRIELQTELVPKFVALKG